ncbi:hypothetical protein AAG747_00630 [Rapidithrix thailandica]|uniref:Uncharacterized protein n=1 Tax=Rapidithrix thailandica TaxID=413964 RepID=A0AAW9S1V9_9BACT
MRKIILFELNEVPFKVIDHYCKTHPKSTLAEIMKVSSQIETVTEDTGHLSPWITWPTLHRGVSNKHHQIKDFGEDLSGVNAKYPSIWEILINKGISTGVFASMHSFPAPANYKDYAFYVPDPFAGDSLAHPEKLMPFQQFNLAMSRKSGRNVDTGIDMKSATSLALSLPGLGIKSKTMMDVAGQLVAERTTPWKKTRRRTFQTVLAFDVYLKLLKKTAPAFSTYFSNHVASTMHRYWAATFPEDYKQYDLSQEWKQTYQGEIDFTMGKLNDFLQALIRFIDANPEYKLVMASSMGQKATIAEQLKTEVYCEDFNNFLRFFELPEGCWEIKPAMHPQYNLTLDEPYIEPFKENLDQLEINGKPISYRLKGNFFSIDLGHRNMDHEYVLYKGEKVPFEKLGITNIPIDDETGSTAYHVPEGSLVVYDPKDKTPKKERQYGVNSVTIVPSILDNFNIPVPKYMTSERIDCIAK